MSIGAFKVLVLKFCDDYFTPVTAWKDTNKDPKTTFSVFNRFLLVYITLAKDSRNLTSFFFGANNSWNHHLSS